MPYPESPAKPSGIITTKTKIAHIANNKDTAFHSFIFNLYKSTNNSEIYDNISLHKTSQNYNLLIFSYLQ